MTALLKDQKLIQTCKEDGEFMMACRHFTGSILFNIGDEQVGLSFENGIPVMYNQEEKNSLIISAPDQVWAPLLKAKPDRMFVDINLLIAGGYAQLDGSSTSTREDKNKWISF